MTQPNPLSVSDFFARYLEQQINAHAHGLGHAEPSDEATPFDTAQAPPIDPARAWADCLAAGRFTCTPPPEWPALVQQLEPAVAVPFCLGNYPQLVRDLHPLLTGEAITLQLQEPRPIALAGLLTWAEASSDEPRRYLAAGVARLARRFDVAEKLLSLSPSPIWQETRDNESAALTWHRGEHQSALFKWQSQPDSTPVLFNRGMAALFLGEVDLAKKSLRAAMAHLPETDAWHHLAGLYLSLSQTR